MCEKTKQLGQLMRNARKANKLSVREVSELTGIHPGAITKFEMNKTDMTISRTFNHDLYNFKTEKEIIDFVNTNFLEDEE